MESAPKGLIAADDFRQLLTLAEPRAILRAAGHIQSKLRRSPATHPKASHACPYCKSKFGARELQAHKTRCEARPKTDPAAKRRGRPPKPRECKYCKKSLPTVEMLVHEPQCPERAMLSVA